MKLIYIRTAMLKRIPIYLSETKVSFLVLCLFGIVLPGYTQAVTENLIGYYSFNNSVSDSRGNNNGTINGEVKVTFDRFSSANSAFQFNGTGFIEIGNFTEHPYLFTESFTICFWIKSYARDKRMFALSIEDSASINENLNIEFNDDSGCWAYWNGGGATGIIGGSLNDFTDNSWKLVVLKRDAFTKLLSLSINGKLVGQRMDTAQTIGSNTTKIILGRNASTSFLQDKSWMGDIDDLSLFNKCLSEEEERKMFLDNGLIRSYSLNPSSINDITNQGGQVLNIANGADRLENVLEAAVFYDSSKIELPPFGEHPRFLSESFTISFWIRSESANRQSLLAYADNADSNLNLNIDLNSSFGLWAFWNGGGYPGLTTGAMFQYTDNKWHNIVFRRNKGLGRVDLFLDGMLKNSTLYTTTDTARSVSIPKLFLGKNESRPEETFTGSMDDVQIYNRSLPDYEIENAYKKNDQLVANFQFNNNTLNLLDFKDAVGYNTSFCEDRDSNHISALCFDGDSYLKITPLTRSPYVFSGDFTIAFWMRGDSSDKRMYAFSMEDTLSPLKQNLNIQFNDGRGCWVYWNSDGENSLFAGQLGEYTDGQWKFVVLRRSRQDHMIELLINGVALGRVVDTSSDVGSNNTNIILGANIESQSAPALQNARWKGNIDDLLIYSKWLPDHLIDSLKLTRKKAIKLLQPSLKNKWRVGSKHKILWKAPAETLFVNIDITTDDGLTWNNLVKYVPNTGSAIWEVFNELSDSCRIKVYDAEDTSNVAISKSLFSIYPSDRISGCFGWQLMNGAAAFEPRDGAGTLVYKDSLWLLGGWNPYPPVNFPKGSTNQVYRSGDGINWELATSNALWEERHSAGYLTFNDSMWIVGGDPIQGHYQNDVWASADGVNWVLVKDSVPWGPRVLHYTVAFDSLIWVMGGQTLPPLAAGERIFYNDVWNSKDGIHWNLVKAHAPWSPRGGICGQVVFKNRIWLLGGGVYETDSTLASYSNEIWNTKDGINWSLVSSNPPWNSRIYHNVVVFNDRMWVIGGAHDNIDFNIDGTTNYLNKKDIWYSSDGNNWYQLEDAPWQETHASSVFVFDDGLWFIPGMFSTVWKFSCDSSVNTNTVLRSSYSPVAKLEEPSGLKLFPIPTRDNLNAVLPSDVLFPVLIEIYDMSGRLIMSRSMNGRSQLYSLSVLTEGLYIIKLTDRNKKVVGIRKVLKL